MIITKLEEINKSKVKVYIDYEYAFLLYQKDIANYQLMEGSEITPLVYEELLNKIVFLRAKLKALALLKFMDRTELELRNKLKDAGYTEEIVDKTIAYINSYGYLNDERLTSSYVRNRMNTKSKLMIKLELQQKGISNDTIDQVFKEEYEKDGQEDAEVIAINKAIAKKVKSTTELNYEEKQKLIAALYRKGFDIGKVKQILD